MLSSSLKPFFEAIQVPPTLFPHELHPENYAEAWNKAPWARYFANTFLVEAIFDWPGLGSYVAASTQSLDTPAIIGVTLLIAIVYVVSNLIVDIVQAFLDPRIRLG